MDSQGDDFENQFIPTDILFGLSEPGEKSNREACIMRKKLPWGLDYFVRLQNPEVQDLCDWITPVNNIQSPTQMNPEIQPGSPLDSNPQSQVSEAHRNVESSEFEENLRITF